MAGSYLKPALSLLLLTILTINLSAALSPTSFILNSCKPTTYPSLCFQSLSSYSPLIRHRSPRQLANLALIVSAARARETSTFISRLSSSSSGHSARPQRRSSSTSYQDCIATMNDSAYRLHQSIREFGRLGRSGRQSFAQSLSNVQTWVSAALTDQSVCLASLLEGVGEESRNRVHVATRMKVAEVSRFTSNALALVNRLGSRN